MKPRFFAALILAAVLPLHAMELPVQFKKHGPNCYNSALVYAGVMDHFRFVSFSELELLLQSDLCQEIEADLVQPGDIRIYYRNLPNLTQEQRTVHANLFINKNQSLNKMNPLLTSQTKIESNEVVDKVHGYTFPQFTFRNENGEPVSCKESDCVNKKKFFRCSPLENKLTGSHLDPSANELFKTYQTLSRQVSDKTFDFSPWEPLDQELASFQDQFLNYCENKSKLDFICLYYSEAIQSISRLIKMTQPSQTWLDEYFDESGNT